MDKEELKEKLQEKLEEENVKFINSFKNKSAISVLDKTYELAIKAEIAASYCERTVLDERKLEQLLKIDNTLDALYELYQESDALIGCEIANALDNEVNLSPMQEF